MNGAALGPCPHCGQAHPEEMLVCPTRKEQLPLAGRLLSSKFRFENLLGEGGMGWVWKAENVLVKKAVAIKLMRPEFASNPAILARFRNEATAAGQIGSPHICDILDFGQSDLGPFIVMEMMKGRSLGELIEKSGRVEPGLAVIIVRQALEGLSAAHRAGIIHRDLKPDNIFLSEPAPGRLLVKLMDFGISKFSQDSFAGKTGVGVLMGTPEYMSPEQSQGAANVDERTDIWAMGLILYKSISGIDAFGGPTIAATLVNVATREPPPLHSIVPVPPQLGDVIARCIAKDPAHRFASAMELSMALAPFEGLAAIGGPMPTQAPSGSGTHAPMGPGTHAPGPMSVALGPGTHAPAGPGPMSVAPGPGTHAPGPMSVPPMGPGPMSVAPVGQAPRGGTQVTPGPGFVAEASAPNGEAPRGGTWSSELPRAPAADDTWSLGHAEIAEERRRPVEKPSSKGPIYAILGLIVVGLGVGAYFALGDPGGGGETPTKEHAEVGPDTATKTSETPNASASAGAATSGAVAVTAGTTGAPEATSAAPATSTSTTTTTTTGDPDPTKATTEPDPDPPHKTKKAPKKTLKDVLTAGGYATPTKAPDALARTPAKKFCQDLSHGGSDDWELATLSQAEAFKGTRGMMLTLYWTQDLVDRNTGKALNLRNGDIKELPIADKARPLCVTKK